MDAAEREDFDAFVRSRMPQLLGFANALTGDPHRAADLVQDALERTALAWSRVVRRDHPEAYVRRVMVNQHISVWRRLRREHLQCAFGSGHGDVVHLGKIVIIGCQPENRDGVDSGASSFLREFDRSERFVNGEHGSAKKSGLLAGDNCGRSFAQAF